jgi:phosphoribosylformylglycinamidine synthase subunit PurS
MMKSSVLDPQGQTVRRALQGLGHASIAEVRQGKCFEVDFAPGTSREAATKELERIGSEILSNPVIEDFRVEIS